MMTANIPKCFSIRQQRYVKAICGRILMTELANKRILGVFFSCTKLEVHTIFFFCAAAAAILQSMIYKFYKKKTLIIDLLNSQQQCELKKKRAARLLFIDIYTENEQKARQQQRVAAVDNSIVSILEWLQPIYRYSVYIYRE